ncbi:hypothetical protein IFR05_015772 [Cadophora sp. M221]|nr:hypothetical protein IFR05_015772 [Cadophora sp. M221]
MAGSPEPNEFAYYPYTSRKKPVTSATLAAGAEEEDDEDDDEDDEDEEEEGEKDAEIEEEEDEEEEPVPAKSRKVIQGLKTDAYEDRAAFGIPRLALSKEEFITIRRNGLLTTDVYNNVGMDAKKSVMITNKEVAALTTLRASRGIIWKYEPSNKYREKWLLVTNQRCEVYEWKMNDKIIKNLTKAIAVEEAKKKRSGGDGLGGEERFARRARRE